MKHRHILIFMILAWASLSGLIPPLVHAGTGTEDRGKDLTLSARRLLIEVRERMDQRDYKGAIDLICSDRERARDTSGADTDTATVTHPLIGLALGNSYLMLSNYAKAESAYLAALTLAPDFMDARINLAKVYADSGQWGKAAQAFRAAYERSNPRQADYLYYSAAMSLTNGQTEAAIGHFETLFATHPDEVVRQWQENFAQALMTAHHYKRALPLVQELAAHATGREKIRWQETRLHIYLQTDDLAQAHSYATTLSRNDCTVAKWWKALVHIHLSLGHYPQALDTLIVYGFLSPLTREEKKLCADLSLQLQIPARAVHTYETILAETQETPIIQRLVNAYRQLGKGDKALNLLNHFDPTACDPEILLLKGDLLYEAKAFESANEAFSMAAQGDGPKKGQAWLMAGYAAWHHNDLKGSRSAFEKAARFKGHRKDAMAAMAQLERTIPM